MKEAKKFQQFNNLYGLTRKQLTHEKALNTAKLIMQEVVEFVEEFYEMSAIETDMVGGIDFVLGNKIEKPNLNNAFKELEDVRYITGQQMTELGGDVSAIGDEVHRSNMSKSISAGDVVREIEIARARYPSAIDTTQDCEVFVLKCSETGKVIKPTIYSAAVITDAMIGKN
jgi:predicted HAD superfamily Cof-like phosphohydrolase